MGANQELLRRHGARGSCMQCQRCFAERVCKGYLVRPVPAHLFSVAHGAVLFLLRFGRGPERGCCQDGRALEGQRVIRTKRNSGGHAVRLASFNTTIVGMWYPRQVPYTLSPP